MAELLKFAFQRHPVGAVKLAFSSFLRQERMVDATPVSSARSLKDDPPGIRRRLLLPCRREDYVSPSGVRPKKQRPKKQLGTGAAGT